MKNQELNHEDSLSLINEMIVQARNNFQKGTANSSIMAGYSVAVVAILNFVLLHTLENPNQSFWLWLLMIPMSAVSTYIGNKQDKTAMVKTHIDRIVGSIWSAFGYSITVLLIVIFGTAYIFELPRMMLLITPIILILTALAQYITATACRFQPYYYGSLIFAISALLCVVSYSLGCSSVQFIILAAAFLLGFVIPGYMLNKKSKRKCLKN